MRIGTFMIWALFILILATSGCTTMVSDTFEEPLDTIGNATCTELCNACERCSEKWEATYEDMP